MANIISFYDYYQQNPSSYTDHWLGFPTYFHADTFFQYAPDNQGFDDYYSFATYMQSNRDPSNPNTTFYEQVKSWTAEDLLNFVKKKTNEKINKLTNETTDTHYHYIPAVIIHGRYTPQVAAFLLFQWLNYIEGKLDALKNEDNEALINVRKELIVKIKKSLAWRTKCQGTLEQYV